MQLGKKYSSSNSIFQTGEFEKSSSDHGGSDSTVIKRRQQQLGRMADFLPPVTFSVFYLSNYEAPHVKSQTMRHPLMNLVNTTLSQKYGDP